MEFKKFTSLKKLENFQENLDNATVKKVNIVLNSLNKIDYKELRDVSDYYLNFLCKRL